MGVNQATSNLLSSTQWGQILFDFHTTSNLLSLAQWDQSLSDSHFDFHTNTISQDIFYFQNIS